MIAKERMGLIKSGVFTPVPTWYKNDKGYSLDLDTQIKHAEYLYRSGINGLVVAGSMGESAHLTRQERFELVKATRDAIPDKKFLIIGGAFGSAVEDSIEETKSLAKAGADVAIILVPSYFGPSLTTQQGIINWFTAVADESALPILIYNYPGVSNNVEVTLETYRELSQHKNIIGCKLTHFNLTLYTTLANDPIISKADFKPMTGLGQLLMPSLSVGIDAGIDGSSGVFPKSLLNIIKLFKAGKVVEAQKLQYLVTKFNDLVAAHNSIGIKFAVNKLLGIGSYVYGRPPLNVEVEVKSLSRFDQDYDELLAYEKSL